MSDANLGRRSNPVFGSRKLKLGTFQTNMDSGCVMSSLDSRLEITWPNTLALARMADRMDFEAIVPVARWRGFGGANNPQGPGFETYTWAAGLGASTERAGIVATSHVTINHPIVAAKQCATIDHISAGRLTLNVVTGWNKPEIEMFGTTLLDHDQRYDCAEEWLQVVRKLWSAEEQFDFEGQYYHIKAGYLEPKPVQQPFPAVMNAGGSERGRRFAAQNCDIVYTVLTSTNPEDCKNHVKAYREMAHNEFGRDLKVWSLAYVVQAETEAQARAFYQDYVHSKGDWEAASNVIDTMGMNAKTIPPERLQAMKERFIAGWSGYPLIGTRDQVVDGLKSLSDMGLDGVLLSWPSYLEGMATFQRETYPTACRSGTAFVKPEILVFEREAPLYVERLAQEFPNAVFHAATRAEDALVHAENAVAIVALAHEVSAAFAARARRLRWIAALTTGTDHLDTLPLADDVLVTSTRGMHGPQMAELAFLFMLSLARDARGMFDNQGRHVWLRWPQSLLYGKTATLVGVGAIAEELALRCKAFGMRTLGVSATRREARGFDALYPRERLNQAASEADYLIALAPYTPQTHHMIGAETFAAMKASATFINIARGNVADEAALIEALRSASIASAGLDVFAREPLPADNPLWDMPNVLVTPHIGGMSDIYAQQALTLLIENVGAFLDGRIGDMVNIVPRRRGP